MLAFQDVIAVSPEQLKISTLEKKIQDMKARVKDLQRFWLREQTHVVGLSEQRQKQIHDMNLLKKRKDLANLIINLLLIFVFQKS